MIDEKVLKKFSYGQLLVNITKIPHRKNFITVAEAADKYKIDRDRFYQLRKNYPDIFLTIANVAFVDIALIEAALKLKEDLWQYATNNLYHQLTEHMSEFKLAKRLAAKTGRSKEVWVAYLNRSLFALPDYSPTDLRIPSLLVEFVIYGEKLLRMLEVA